VTLLVTVHRYLGEGIVGALALLLVVGIVLRLLGRDEAPRPFWVGQHYLENLLVLQVVIGLVLLLAGRRVVGGPLIWLHYLYGSLFPLIAIVAGRITALRRPERDYVGVTWGAFFAVGLTLRALMTGLGIGV